MEDTVKYKKMARSEISKLRQIDRTETIDNIYYLRDGNLVLEAEHYDVPDWSIEEKLQRISHLQKVFDNGATFFGGFDGFQMVGMSVLDHNPISSGNKRFNLEGLWVSEKYRSKGIGKALFQLAWQEAQKMGAKALYVSATPSKNTVRFYTLSGCKPAELIDPFLFEKEPEDIHLELLIG